MPTNPTVLRRSGMEIALSLKGEITDHQGGIKEIQVHPDGRIFFARSDEMLVIYQVESRRKLRGFYSSEGFEAASFDRASGMLIYLSEEKLHFWDPLTWREKMVISGELLEFRDSDTHPDAGYFASAKNNSIEIRDISADEFDPPEFVLQGHKNYIEYTRFHPLGKILATGSADMTLRFWDLEARTEIASHKVHSDFVTALAFNRDGSMMISGDYSGKIKLWNFKVVS